MFRHYSSESPTPTGHFVTTADSRLRATHSSGEQRERVSCLERACEGLSFIVEQVLLNGEGARHWTDRMGFVSSETKPPRWRSAKAGRAFEPQGERPIRFYLAQFSLPFPWQQLQVKATDRYR